MDDFIKREDAIKAVNKYNACGYVEESFDKLKDALQAVPSIQYTSKIVDAYIRGYKDGADAVKVMPFAHTKRADETYEELREKNE